MKKLGLLIAFGGLAFVAGQANAGIITTYSGLDQGVSSAGPVAQGVEQNFLGDAADFGPVVTETFEELPVGTAGGGGSFAVIGGTASITTPFGDPYGGVLNEQGGPLYAFNTTAGGSNWLGFADGTATFTFDSPTNSFGFYTTALQKEFTSPGTLNVTFNDGSAETLYLPVNGNGGGDSYFGFTDSTGFSSITISNISNDAWGIDDVSYNASPMSSAPEPASWMLMIMGVGLAGYTLRSRKVSTTQVA